MNIVFSGKIYLYNFGRPALKNQCHVIKHWTPYPRGVVAKVRFIDSIVLCKTYLFVVLKCFYSNLCPIRSFAALIKIRIIKISGH